MAMTIGEANSAAVLLRAVTGESTPDVEQLASAMRDLEARASKVLQLRVVSSYALIEQAAGALTQRNADSLAGGGL